MFLKRIIRGAPYLIAIAATHRRSSRLGFGIVRGQHKLRLRLGQHFFSIDRIDGSGERLFSRTFREQLADQANGRTEGSKSLVERNHASEI